jgi:predicted amidohydrolase YtcJ
MVGVGVRVQDHDYIRNTNSSWKPGPPYRQQISRKDALRLYTVANAWFNFEENDMGSIDAGKLADLVVLDKPYLEVSDEELKRMHPPLTMVGGRVVHARAPFAALAQ